MSDTILANATLVLPHEVITGSLRLSDGLITAIDTGVHVPAGAEDCGGDLVMPGLIELHTDNLERHIEPRPKVHFPHVGAILAHDGELTSTGITTVFDALRVGSIVSKDKASYGEYARLLADEILAIRKTGALRINHLLHLRAEVVHLRHYLVGNFGTAAFDDPVKIVHVGDEPAETEVFDQQSR